MTGSGPPSRPGQSGRRPSPNNRLVVPEGRYPAKGVAVDRHPADGGERQVRGHQQVAARKSVVKGKSVAGRGGHGGRRVIQKKNRYRASSRTKKNEEHPK